MGIFRFLFGAPETIWTLDVFIESICTSIRDNEKDPDVVVGKIRRWGKEIGELYGLVGMKHAWRAASSSKNSGQLRAMIREAWNDIPGWRASG
jgi:hypothetical protein